MRYSFCAMLALVMGLTVRGANSVSQVTGLPTAKAVESQPLLAQVNRLEEAMLSLGSPLPAATKSVLAQAALQPGEDRIAAAIQQALDPLCLGAVRVQADGSCSFTPASGNLTLIEQGWRAFLIKVVNDDGSTGTLRVDSPNARPIPEAPASEVAQRWLDLEMMDRRPLNPALSGLALEYRIIQIFARDAGKHTATLAFNFSQPNRGVARVDEVAGKIWDFEKDTAGWRAENDSHIAARSGVLQVTSTGGDPYLSTAVKMPAGEKRVRFRAKTHADSMWQLFWWTEKRPLPHGDFQRTIQVTSNKAQWSEYQITFSAEDKLRGIRLDPGSGPGESEIDWIEIISLDDPSADWIRVPMTFHVERAHRVQLRVRDELGKPCMASFLIRDEQGRIHPMPSKRLAPDFFFQPQIYRADGETLRLPAGSYTIECSRGPESVPEIKNLVVAGKTTLSYLVNRWVDPARHGWFSGDHHIHAAGCLHYANPTEGVHAPDMQRHIMGEDLKVGCNLTWGPCFDYQKQFFRGKLDPVSQYPYLLRYDIEVSGFGSHQSGHLCLLRLKDQMYPGGDSKKHWPTLGLNTLRWAKAQGAVCGPAHSAIGLGGNTGRVAGVDGPDGLPNYIIPAYDGIGANEFVVDITHEVPGPDGRLVPAVDFISTMNTDRKAEFNMWYHALNCGFQVRASGETDFPCITGERVGKGRVYVRQRGRLDFDDWCEGLRQGRSYVSDGTSHLMDFKAVAAQSPQQTVSLGEHDGTLRLSQRGSVRFSATVAIRNSNQGEAPLELIVNGFPAARQLIPADGKEREVAFDIPIERSSWVALRTYPRAHTNPIFVVVGGQPVRASRRSAEWLLAGVEQCWKQKERTYAEAEQAQARADYEHARQTYRRILAESPVD